MRNLNDFNQLTTSRFTPKKYNLPSCSPAGSRHVLPQPTSQHFALPEQSLSLEHFLEQVSVGFTVGHRPGFTSVLFTETYKKKINKK